MQTHARLLCATGTMRQFSWPEDVQSCLLHMRLPLEKVLSWLIVVTTHISPHQLGFGRNKESDHAHAHLITAEMQLDDRVRAPVMAHCSLLASHTWHTRAASEI